MRIKRQFIFSIVVFAIAILVVSVSLVVEDRQLTDISKQAEAANNIQSGANDLNYLTNNFFLYQDDTKLVEWRTTLVSIYDEILKLNSTNLQQQAYVNGIKNDLGDIALSYNGLVTFLWNSPRNVSVRATPEFQKAWNQTSEQYQALNSDSAVLINFIADQATQVRSTITELVLAVFGLFGAYFLTNYLVTYRRTIKSILGLKAVTAIVGAGNLDYQIKVERKDEIGELAVAFNQMTSHLKSVTASKTELDKEISERKKEEAKLKESEEKYQTTFEGSMDALMLLDGKGFFDCNKATLLLFGCRSIEEFTKFHPADLSPLIQPNGLPSMESALGHISRAFKTGTDSFFWVHKRVDGTTFPADVLLTRITLKGKDILQATVRDITQQIEAEEKLRESSQRIESINEKLRVVGGLTRHDARNKLSAVTGYAYLLKKKHSDQADIVEGLGKMEQAVKDTMKIFDFAKMYEQIGAEKLTYIVVEEKLKEAVALFSGPIPKITNECHGLTLLADSFLRQLFYNFIDNTIKYGQKTSAIRVSCEKTDQGNLKLIYEDDGVGVPLENKTCLFKEGFSTGGSTGFGLFLTKKMTDVYGWTITEEGEPGKGAKFVITIPSSSVSIFET